MADSSILLQRSKKKDEIAIGFKRDVQNSRPILEHIGKLVAGKVPNLNVKCAFEVDGKANTSYDYVTGKTTPCPNAGASGSFMLLACTADGFKPSELLQPVYDFCQRLNAPPFIWYYQKGTVPKGEYMIAEARLGMDCEEAFTLCNMYDLAGMYYVSYAKMLPAIEKLTRPQMEGGWGEIRGMVEKDAYYLHTWDQACDRDSNWRSAQRRMVMRVIRHMKEDAAFIWFKISGRLETDYSLVGELSDVDKRIVYTHLLGELKDDDSIHLIPAAIPVRLYINAYLTGGL